MGGYLTYGQAENYRTSLAENLLPIGLAEGCRLKRDIIKDALITRADVEVPPDRISDGLRTEQDDRFRSEVTRAA
jgi:predicted homoserine dehydrogenase-like protein